MTTDRFKRLTPKELAWLKRNLSDLPDGDCIAVLLPSLEQSHKLWSRVLAEMVRRRMPAEAELAEPTPDVKVKMVGQKLVPIVDPATLPKTTFKAIPDLPPVAVRRRPTCSVSSKVRFESEKQARRSMRHMADRLRVYRCTYCGGWHLTSQVGR